jgi:GDP-4-dehydro-6-deoxy-D-mannose reductase
VRILVTGARGFAGTHLLAELARSGTREITAAGLGEEDDPPAEPGSPGIRWMSLDVTSAESVRRVVRESRPAQIYHLAGQASVGESFQEPLRTWEVNATGTLRMLEVLREEGFGGSRLLLTSSAEVYGNVPVEEQPIADDRPVEPLTPYGASKAAAEIAARQYARAGMVDVVIARSFNQIGPGQDERFVLPSLARQLARMGRGDAEPVLHVGNLDVRRDFLDVRDGVRGYVRIMERGESGQSYNVAAGASRSLREVVGRLVELSGVNARLEVDADRVRPVDIPELIGDSAPLRGLGWEPEYPLDATLGDLLRETAGRAEAHG